MLNANCEYIRTYIEQIPKLLHKGPYALRHTEVHSATTTTFTNHDKNGKKNVHRTIHFLCSNFFQKVKKKLYFSRILFCA